MLPCSSLVKHFTRRVLFVVVSALLIQCDGFNHLFEMKERDYCPSIETLSFGSDIDVQCNDTYLIFNEMNKNGRNWQFANQSLFCQQQGKHHAFVNQCNVIRIDSTYLKVPVRSVDHHEQACIYCPINYKPIAPLITVTQSHNDYHTVYTFNLTARGLADDESFEILWAKRSGPILNSFNYWFLQRCIDPSVKILQNTGHTIVFLVGDGSINRVELIIRRCRDTCRSYRTCDIEEFSTELSSNTFDTPDSIEKISCNYNCLNGLMKTTTSNSIIGEGLLASTIRLTHGKQTIKFLILYPLLGLLIVLLFIILGIFLIYRMKRSRTESVYTKASQVNLDENK